MNSIAFWAALLSGSRNGMDPRVSATSLRSCYADGLSINSTTGEIFGTPTGTGVSPGIVVRVTDDIDQTDDLPSFTITVRNSLIRLVDQRSHIGAATFTLDDVECGQEHASRVIAVAATGAGVSHEVSGMVIASATGLGVATTNDRSAAIYFAATPTGETADIDVTVSNINIFVQFEVFSLYGVDATVFDSDTLVDASGLNDSFNASVSADDDGIVLAGFCSNNNSASVTWTNLDEISDVDTAGFANERHSTAGLMDSAAGTLSVTVETSAATGGSLVVVSFAGL
ncbi:hypothetical protein ACFX5Q_27930 [Mesorhizobium sp. IMUNJ 23033]|uniref:hypothetical protein n=1 Tax=Mesorhizobium sp. IMUNJ 23033 TaxID=3378039 RepID=UPI0038515579